LVDDRLRVRFVRPQPDVPDDDVVRDLRAHVGCGYGRRELAAPLSQRRLEHGPERER
jgi:hypothetical protein